MDLNKLEKEAQENCVCTDTYMRANYVTGYIAGAEPREKWIEELEEDYKALKTSYNILKDNDEKIIKEMGEQIEKMKCCANCDFIFRDGNCYYDKECKNKDHWKLRR